MYRLGLAFAGVLGTVLAITGGHPTPSLTAAEADSVRGGCWVNATHICPPGNFINCNGTTCTVQASKFVCPIAGQVDKNSNGTFVETTSATPGAITFQPIGNKMCSMDGTCLDTCSTRGNQITCDMGARVGGTPTYQDVESGGPCTSS